jgi:hypothetical protein
MAEAASRPAISNWGIPDPRDAAAYPSTLTRRQWGWQFLRRRQVYRQRWEEVVWPYITDGGGWDLEKEDRDGNEEAQRAHQEGRPFQWRHPFEVLREEFKVCSFSGTLNPALDPRLDRPPIFEGALVTEVLFQRVIEPPEASGKFEPRPPVKTQLEFDHRLPIKSQLAAAHRLLERRAEMQDIQPHVRKFPEYLRLLDFDTYEIKSKEIGRSLFPHAKGQKLYDVIRDNREAAHRWQDVYLRIALSSD